MSVFKMDRTQLDKTMERLSNSVDKSKIEKTINRYLAGEGAEILKEGIHTLLPVSGRKPWKGKAPAAKTVDPLDRLPINLGVDIVTKSRYDYLYFPDDGSTTVRHVGNQQFMLHGIENKAQEVTDNIIRQILEQVEG